MSEKLEEQPSSFKVSPTWDELTFDEQYTVRGFYDLLLKVDQRVNPHLYENTTKE